MTAKIYKPAKNAMQSGRGKQDWILQYIAEDTKFIENVMGWTGNSDTTQQLRLKFETLEEAEAYAIEHKIKYIVVQPKKAKLIKQAYADNFLIKRQ